MVPLPKLLLKHKLLLLQSPTNAMPTQSFRTRFQARHAEVNQLGKLKPSMVVLPKSVVHMIPESTMVLLPKLLLRHKLLLLQSPTNAMPTQSFRTRFQVRHAEVNQLGKPKPFMVVLPRRKENHGMSHFFQEHHWPTHASMLTRLLRLIPLPIKLALPLVTLPGTLTPLPELDPKPLLSMHHIQTIPFTCNF